MCVWVFLSVRICVTQFSLEPVTVSKPWLFQERSQKLAEIEARERSRSSLKQSQKKRSPSKVIHSFIEEIVLKQIVLDKFKHPHLLQRGDLGGRGPLILHKTFP
jgi:hypothetical protein